MSAALRIALLDYGSGNVRSVAKALERSGLAVKLTGEPKEVACADGVVLPGAGAFRDAALALAEKGLPEAIREAIAAGRPYLGLCLGMQLLFEEGQEHGTTQGLGLLRGRVTQFSTTGDDGRPRRVPHIGWNEVRFRGSHPMLAGLPAADCFYFVHSYRAEGVEPACVVGTTDYGGELVSAVATERIFAVQFHPEKSQTAGKRLLDAYAAWVAACR